MSSISALTSYPVYGTSPNQPLQPPGTDTEGARADGTQHVHRGGGHRHGGGQMQQALAQALQSLGLAPTQGSTPASGSGNTSGQASDPDGDNDGASTERTVRKDMHQFMHSLYEAVKSENPGTGTSSTGASGDAGSPKANFSAGLSALISQASSGNAPAGLQDAFNKLTSDLQAQSPGGSSGDGSTSGTGATQPVTLQDLLSQIQQNLGYSNTSPGATDNILNTKV